MRRSELKRKTALHRHVRVRPRNARRLKRLRSAQFGPQAALCRTMPCCACHKPAPSDPHHLKTRGAGGDDSFCIPLCRFCHDALHHDGPSFWNFAHVNPEDVMLRMRAFVIDQNTDALPVSPLLLWLDGP